MTRRAIIFPFSNLYRTKDLTQFCQIVLKEQLGRGSRTKMDLTFIDGKRKKTSLRQHFLSFCLRKQCMIELYNSTFLVIVEFFGNLLEIITRKTL